MSTYVVPNSDGGGAVQVPFKESSYAPGFKASMCVAGAAKLRVGDDVADNLAKSSNFVNDTTSSWLIGLGVPRTFFRPTRHSVNGKSSYSAKAVADAIASASKRDEEFLTEADVVDMAEQLGVSPEAVKRELAAQEARPQAVASQQAGVEVMGLVTFRAGHDCLHVDVKPPGWRRPVLGQLLGLAAAACICVYWLWPFKLWAVATTAFFVVMASRACALALQKTVIDVESRTITIDTEGFLGGDSRSVELSDSSTLSVQRDAEKMTIEFFPAYYLSIQGTNGHFKVLETYDPQVIELVRKRIAEWLRSSKAHGRES